LREYLNIFTGSIPQYRDEKTTGYLARIYSNGNGNAVANLADMAGNVTVTVKAENPAGLDKAKLQNGVLEPLREADLIE